MPRVNPRPMRRQIRLWVNPSKSKNDYVVATGSGVSDDDSSVNVSYRNTEVCVEFKANHIEVSTYDVQANGNIGNLLERTTYNYSKRSTQKDCTKDLDTVELKLPGVNAVKVPADFRHTVVLVATPKKKKKKKT